MTQFSSSTIPALILLHYIRAAPTTADCEMAVDWKRSMQKYERELAEYERDPAADPSKILMLRNTVELAAWMLSKTEEKRAKEEKQREAEKKLEEAEIEDSLARLMRVQRQEFLSKPRVCGERKGLFGLF